MNLLHDFSKVDWWTISKQQNLSKEFVETNKNKLILREVFKSNKYSSKFLRNFIFPNSKYNLVFGIGTVDIVIFLQYQRLSYKLLKLIFIKYKYDLETMSFLFKYQKLPKKLTKYLIRQKIVINCRSSVCLKYL